MMMKMSEKAWQKFTSVSRLYARVSCSACVFRPSARRSCPTRWAGRPPDSRRDGGATKPGCASQSGRLAGWKVWQADFVLACLLACLPSGGKARGQPLRQVCGQDAFLSLLQVIGRAAKGNDSGGRVVYRKCRPPIPVARLPDRAGVDHVAHAFFERELCGLRLAHSVVKRTEIIAGNIIGGETSLQMGMPE